MADAETSRAALARAVGIDRSTVTQMLATEDVRMPGGHVVANVATALGVSSDWLLGLSDRPERVSALIDTSLSISDAGRATGADDQIFAWHEEAAGYKIRHVPATMPDVLKTDALMQWEYAPATVKTPGQAIAAAHARLEWMRGTTSDYEIAIALHEFESFVAGTGYYEGLDPEIRRETATLVRGSLRPALSQPSPVPLRRAQRVFRTSHGLRSTAGRNLCGPSLHRLPRPGTRTGQQPPFRLAGAGRRRFRTEALAGIFARRWSGFNCCAQHTRNIRESSAAMPP